MVLWKKREARPVAEIVAGIIEEAEASVGGAPEAALRVLERLGGDAYPLVTFGGPLHDRFAAVVARTLGGDHPFPVRGDLGTDHPFPGSKQIQWSGEEGCTTVADVLDRARSQSEPVLYLFEPLTARGGAVAELRALAELAADDDVLMAAVGEINTFLRKEALLSLEGSLDTSSEEVIQEIEDAARRAGFRTVSL